jgi:hypothetical protein
MRTTGHQVIRSVRSARRYTSDGEFISDESQSAELAPPAELSAHLDILMELVAAQKSARDVSRL